MFNGNFIRKGILRFFIIRLLKKKPSIFFFSWRFKFIETLSYKDINFMYAFFKDRFIFDPRPFRNTSEVYFTTEIILFLRDFVEKVFSDLFLNTLLYSVKIIRNIFSDIKIGNGKYFFIFFSIIENQWNYNQIKLCKFSYWPHFFCFFFSKEILYFLNKFLKRYYFWIKFLRPKILKTTNYERMNLFSLYFIESIEIFIMGKNFGKIFKNVKQIFFDLNLISKNNIYYFKKLINFLLNTQIEHQKIFFHDSFSGFNNIVNFDPIKHSYKIPELQISNFDIKINIFKNSYSKLGALLNIFRLKNEIYLILTNSIKRINTIMKITRLYSNKEVINIDLLNKKKKIFERDQILKKNPNNIYFSQIFSENFFIHTKDLLLLFFDTFNTNNTNLKHTFLPIERRGPYLKFFFLTKQKEIFCKLIKKMIAQRLEQKKGVKRVKYF
jgi:hypothetical protein